MSNLRQPFETLLVRIGMAVVPRIPRRGIIVLSRFLGGAAYYVATHLRRVGQANLDIAFGDSRSDDDKRNILRQSFRTFALVLLDLFWFSRNTSERVRDNVQFDSGYDHLFEDGPALCLTGHLGNWELLGQALNLRGVPLVSVAAPLANQDVDRLFLRMRTKTGQVVVAKQGAVRKLMKTLRDGGKIAFLLDQNTKPSAGGLFVDYFGLPVPMSSAAAALHLHTGAEVLFGACLPQPDGRYIARYAGKVELSGMDELAKPEKLQAITQAIAVANQRYVEQFPGAWLWMYKRWKYVAPGREGHEYPFYAKEMLPRDQRAAGVDI